jgi:CBS domain-containing protein
LAIINAPSRERENAMNIASILKTKGGEIVGVPASMSVQGVVALLHKHRIGAVLVMDGDLPVGVVSERDIVKCLHEKGVGILETSAEAIMSSPVVLARPVDSVAEAMSIMTERRIRHLPVVEHGQLIGIVSIGDLVKRRIEEAEHEAELLKGYISAA